MAKSTKISQERVTRKQYAQRRRRRKRKRKTRGCCCFHGKSVKVQVVNQRRDAASLIFTLAGLDFTFTFPHPRQSVKLATVIAGSWVDFFQPRRMCSGTHRLAEYQTLLKEIERAYHP
jgi:hypothetical protein